jgi:pimeloyl-ACP methyl ester carboxylesterase
MTYLHHEAADVLPRVLDAAGIRRAILIGHSDGATIALIHGAHHGGNGHDERVLGLICEAPHVFVEDVCVTGIERTVEAWRTTDLPARLARHHAEGNLDGAFRGWSETWLHPDFRSWNIEDLLPSIACPVQLIQGLDDEYATPLQVEKVADAVAGRAEVLLLPECRHTPHRERKDEVLAAMARFAREVALWPVA